MVDSTVRTRVLIVGAGPVGMAAAIELGHRGIPCLLIERNDRVGYAPRAKTTNVRTREHFRRWGIADALKAASPLGVDYPSNVVFCTRLSGQELTRFENALYCAPGRNPFYSEHSQWIPQYTVEEVMRSHIQSLPNVEMRFNTQLQKISQDEQGVQAEAVDLPSGKAYVIHADYLIGADGARSLVREAIGAKLEGTYGLARHYNIVFRAPGLAQAHKLGPAIMYWQVNGDAPSLIGPMDRGDKWFFMPTSVKEDYKLDLADAPALIRQATGIDLPYEILSSDEWVASRFLSNSYRDRRVFLAGDACHLHPPFGGYGMNMGVADGVDLGWKLAAVLKGWGGRQLLDSYEQERRPVHALVLDEAVANHSVLSHQLWTDGLDANDATGAALRKDVGARIQTSKMREFNTLGVMLGYHYEHSPVIVPDGSPEPGHDFVNYIPSSRPGHLAPHAWMHDGSSLYDHFGQYFTLLASKNAPSEAIDEAQRQAKALGVSLKVIQPQEAGIAELYPMLLTLIRPDQHIAWRGNAWPSATQGLMQQVSGCR
ncbi:FAD-dependent monooxygenase [Limnohabitans sp.]|uniref:FAD-dependent monooxygenase n=1 Tax=Limnohabitans sp. TaxID=1907725 RepID=UPI00286ECD04|nr:FAD-dependent monooxygenase [Limnohabitans sp.]